jgi:predicted ATPase
MNWADLLMRFYLLVSSDTTPTPSSTPTPRPRPYTIYVEGNVGCGKSTFLQLFEGDGRIQARAES